MTAFTILAHQGLVLGTAKKSAVIKAWRLADDGGTIQAGDMPKLTRDPTAHTTISLTSALLKLGCEFRGVREWKSRGNRSL